ncbi:MAG: DNA translocase FtsK 4TM domain-containing protein, partial [Gammaproteobacteria bacterium]|nr:DNA translocase FtsK 4TM domain-containing protein [Gammaproteobacteria bacterium]
MAHTAKKRKSGSTAARSKAASTRTTKKTSTGTPAGRTKGRVINKRHTVARRGRDADSPGTPGVRRLSRAMREVVGIAAIAVSLIMFLALLTFDVNDPGWSHTGTGVRIENSIGRAGAWFADVFYYLFGYMAYLLPIILGIYGWTLFRDKQLSDEDYQPFAFVRVLGFVVMLASAAGLADLHFGVPEGALPHGTFGGGVIGTATAWKLVAIFKPLGTTLVLLPVFFCSLTLAVGSSWLQVIEAMGGWVQAGFTRLSSGFYHWRETQAENQKRKSASQVREESARARKTLLKHKKNRLDDSDTDPLMADPEETIPAPNAVAASVSPPAPARPPKKKKLAITTRPKEEKQFNLFRDVPDSELPPLSLLDPPAQQKPGFSDEHLESLSRLLETKLADFNITVEVVAVHPGPVITRFELQPSPGVKARQITNLTQDIARSLSIVSVRVVEVIAGKSTIGLEVPNDEREIVQLSEMLQSEQYD